MRGALGRSVVVAILFGLAAVALTGISAVPTYRSVERTVEEVVGFDGADPESELGEGGQLGAARGTLATTRSRTDLECAAGRNGGKTDTGVTGTSIRLAATVVRSGIGESFLGGAPTAMQAVVDRINRGGGICGRLLELKTVDDAWDRTKGQKFIQQFIDEGVFALAVVPSSEGLDAVIERGDIKRAGIPVVGSDGMLRSQYRDPWVWSVAVSTVSTMHIVVQEAYNQGARTFGIVFDRDYKFGVEGAEAFNAAVKRLTDQTVAGYSGEHNCRQAFCGIRAGQGSYSSEVQEFAGHCDELNSASGFHPQGPPGALPSCDLIALLLDPTTALTWITKNGGPMPKEGGLNRVMGPQPLFNADFAKSCGHDCQDMVVFTSYNPPIPPYANHPAVSDYVATVRQLNPSLDVTNAFTEGAFLGMNALAEALKRVGPDVTRDALRRALYSGNFDLGISPPIQWRQGNHLGNGQMQGFQFEYQGAAFVGFRLKREYIRDPWLGEDI